MVIPGDSEDLRALSRQMGADCEVQLLDDANSALWEVRSTPPDVIVANVELPGMSGLDLAEILPNFGLVTRVVLWSGATNPQAAQQAAGFGVHRFLTAPVSPDDLRHMVQDELREAQAAGSAPIEVAEVPAAPEPETPPPTLPERQRRLHDVAPAPPPSERQRRLHDVSPAPPDRQRRSAEGGSASLADRARRAAQEAPPAEQAPARPSQTRQGALVLTADSLKPLRARMEALEREVGSQCIMLADRAGMMLVEVGLTAGLPIMILLPLLSTSFSTAGQISQMLREKESSALYMHEGVNYDVYCFDVLQRFMLVVVFSKGGSAPAKIGTVWVYAKRAIRDMEELLG
jgi:CheY-like chemotaxis protein